jgi:hypothetical protein
MKAEPIEHSLEIMANSVGAEPQVAGDVRVRESFSSEQRDLRLAASEAEADAELLRGREIQALAVPVECREACGERAAEGHDRQETLGGSGQGRQGTAWARRIRGFERALE